MRSSDRLSRLSNFFTTLRSVKYCKVNPLLLANLSNAKCPNCGKVAKNKNEVEELFGYRINEGIKMVQSWCRKCRSLYS